MTAINLLLEDVFGVGLAYVEDNLDMTINYVFNFPMTAFFQDTLVAFDLLPRPGGVGITITIDLDNIFFGFGPKKNFDNAAFGA